MARIRAVKPEVRRSLTVSQWPPIVRLAWIYLWGYLDDEGRGVDDMRLIVAELFPLDRNVTEKKMDTWLHLMASTTSAEDDEPPVCRYEVAGRRYLHAPKWAVHQRINRPQPSRLPQCPFHERSVNDSVNGSRSSSVNRSVTGSLPSRAPADQGSGKGTGNREQGTGKAATPTAQTLIAEWLDHCPKRPPGSVIGQIAQGTGKLLDEGIHPDDIRRGLAAWAAKGLHPSTLASVVNERMNATGRPSTTDTAIAQTLTLAAKYDQQDLQRKAIE